MADMTHRYWRDGTPVLDGDLELYRRRRKDLAYKVVEKTELPDGRKVSTVWLGDDQDLGEGNAPLIFETMVFPECELVEHTSTEADARAAHVTMVAKCLLEVPQ